MVMDIPFKFHSYADPEGYLKERIEQPRQFLRDSLEMFLIQGKGLDKKGDIQHYQKNNLIEWFIKVSELVTSKLTTYTQFILTINRSFYANNPIEHDVHRF